MTDNPINVAGIEIPSDSPIFLAALGMHILVGLSCVVAGVGAMLIRKRPGRHPRFGTIYYYCLSLVFASAAILSAMHWAEDYHFFILGSLSFGTASLGRMAIRRHWRNWIRLHITCMGLSYILLLTAFYVDNGKNLPHPARPVISVYRAGRLIAQPRPVCGHVHRNRRLFCEKYIGVAECLSLGADEMDKLHSSMKRVRE